MKHDDTPPPFHSTPSEPRIGRRSSAAHPPLPAFLTAPELAARWRITTMTLRRWRRAGKLRACYIGRGVRFTTTEVERFEREAEA